MQFAAPTAQLAVLFVAAALPVVHGSIAIGNQIREGGTHYNVAWTEGLNPCSVAVEIGPESEKLCNERFDLDDVEYYLADCSSPGTGYAQNPSRLRNWKDDSLYGNCSPTEKKIHCKGDTHDVIKRYLCN
ncbi:hypothetical protein F4779DRAFT_427707 [Xylariaceae sp. FL0662B]|nr:hypothetical protein F4779DRAFT_427707 [Xylariaceae sp. FL0662B]